MKNPACWRDVLQCGCASCLALAEIYGRCVAFEEPAFVCDCRMHVPVRPWLIGNIETLFSRPTPETNRFSQQEAAIASVLGSQRHCDVFFRSWPLRPDGQSDYAWSRVEVA